VPGAADTDCMSRADDEVVQDELLSGLDVEIKMWQRE
jgi:hypothetical protein